MGPDKQGSGFKISAGESGGRMEGNARTSVWALPPAPPNSCLWRGDLHQASRTPGPGPRDQHSPGEGLGSPHRSSPGCSESSCPSPSRSKTTQCTHLQYAGPISQPLLAAPLLHYSLLPHPCNSGLSLPSSGLCGCPSRHLKSQFLSWVLGAGHEEPQATQSRRLTSSRSQTQQAPWLSL